MHLFVWFLQVVIGVYFIAIGGMHLVVPDGLPDQMAWMYDLPAWAHYVSGAAEILGGLGLILPGLTRIKPQLTPLAASGLVVIMVAAMLWHLPRGEMQNLVANLVLAALLVFIAYVRWRKIPLHDRATSGR